MTTAMSLCPFCGSTSDSLGQTPFPSGRLSSEMYWICRCGNPECGAEVIGETPAEAVARWNRRTIVLSQQSRLK